MNQYFYLGLECFVLQTLTHTHTGLWDSRSSISSSRDSLDISQLTGTSVDDYDSDVMTSPSEDDPDTPKTPATAPAIYDYGEPLSTPGTPPIKKFNSDVVVGPPPTETPPPLPPQRTYNNSHAPTVLKSNSAAFSDKVPPPVPKNKPKIPPVPPLKPPPPPVMEKKFKGVKAIDVAPKAKVDEESDDPDTLKANIRLIMSFLASASRTNVNTL